MDVSQLARVFTDLVRQEFPEIGSVFRYHLKAKVMSSDPNSGVATIHPLRPDGTLDTESPEIPGVPLPRLPGRGGSLFVVPDAGTEVHIAYYYDDPSAPTILECLGSGRIQAAPGASKELISDVFHSGDTSRIGDVQHLGHMQRIGNTQLMGSWGLGGGGAHGGGERYHARIENVDVEMLDTKTYGDKNEIALTNTPVAIQGSLDMEGPVGISGETRIENGDLRVTNDIHARYVHAQHYHSGSGG